LPAALVIDQILYSPFQFRIDRRLLASFHWQDHTIGGAWDATDGYLAWDDPL
jgi:hypothetical protein